jgi:two-component system KDP operon response regulator KdpE
MLAGALAAAGPADRGSRGALGRHHVEHSHYLRVFMTNLRLGLERPGVPLHLVTEIGIGCQFVP